MQITYKAHAITKPEYMRKPSPEHMPTLVDADDIGRYTKLGWMLIGNATVTVDFLSDEEMAAQKLDALRAELQTVRAENQKRENAILDQISKLQALTFEQA